MATVTYIKGAPVIQAEQPEELELLAHGRDNGGLLILDGAEYAVDQQRLLLPGGCSAEQATRVCAALEQAARNHHLACTRRRSFRLI